MTFLPEARPPARNGTAPQGPPGQWIVIGPRTRAQLAAQLERSMGVLLLALLETSGAPEGAGYTLVLDGAHLEPIQPVPPRPARPETPPARE